MLSVRQAFLNALDGIAYVADAQGCIVDVGQCSWTESLRLSGFGGAADEQVTGRNLFDAMSGQEVRSAYKAVHDAVITGTRSHVSFELRCDAPDVRRVLRLSVTALKVPSEPVAALYQSQVLSAVSRPWMSLFDPARIVDQVRAERDLPIVRICSFCHDVAWPVDDSKNWVSPTEYYRLSGPAEMRTSHGVCSRCRDRVLHPCSTAEPHPHPHPDPHLTCVGTS